MLVQVYPAIANNTITNTGMLLFFIVFMLINAEGVKRIILVMDKRSQMITKLAKWANVCCTAFIVC